MIKKLIEVQKELKAPKDQENTFGKYKYRNCEDILEAVKPKLEKVGLLLTISDEIVNIGDRFYVKATASVTDGDKVISVSALAREELIKKGMDGSQITGSASSYARKYALGGLFCIDDNKDADSTNDGKNEVEHKCVVCNKPVADDIAEKSFKKYGAVYCSKICKDSQVK